LSSAALRSFAPEEAGYTKNVAENAQSCEKSDLKTLKKITMLATAININPRTA